MTIGDLALWEKTGGRSGTYRREAWATLRRPERFGGGERLLAYF